MKLDEMTERETNIYRNLQQQKDSVMRNGHECSIGTRRRYNDALDLYCKIMATEFAKQNIKKINNNHLERVVEVLQESGYSKSTVSNTMSAIRYFYRKAIGLKFRIKSNKELGVDSRGKEDRIGPNRAMTEKEKDDLIDCAFNKGRMDFVFGISIANLLGLRIHEVFKLRRSTVKKALKSGKLRTVGKGGLVRYQSLNNKQSDLLKGVLEWSDNGDDRIFVKKNEAHRSIKDMQEFIAKNRDGIQKPGRYKITFHSLRHKYAQDRYRELRDEGLTDLEARYQLTSELGHGRVSVTDVYLKDFSEI